MVRIICKDRLTQMEVIIKSKFLLKGILGNEETASKTIRKITIISVNCPVTSKTLSNEMDLRLILWIRRDLKLCRVILYKTATSSTNLTISSNPTEIKLPDPKRRRFLLKGIQINCHHPKWATIIYLRALTSHKMIQIISRLFSNNKIKSN